MNGVLQRQPIICEKDDELKNARENFSTTAGTNGEPTPVGRPSKGRAHVAQRAASSNHTVGTVWTRIEPHHSVVHEKTSGRQVNPGSEGRHNGLGKGDHIAVPVSRANVGGTAICCAFTEIL